MIDETILYLPHTGCDDSPLKEYELELDSRVNWDPDIRLGEPLKRVFSKVIRYDVGQSYAKYGVGRTNNEIIELVRAERPKYVMWPSMSYEIMGSTFQRLREIGTFVVGWFFDDECRFDDYSRWWIPYLDYVLTVDKWSVEKYQQLCTFVRHLLVTSNPEVFKRLELEKRYDASFIGTKIADREYLTNKLKENGIQLKTFGRGWRSGYISLKEMIKLYNVTKVNLCFVKSYGTGTRPQMKDKIFDICMCGGFLLCEYLPGIENLFKIDEEIVCFTDIEEATQKIQYYLDNEAQRQAIARAGWERAQRDHAQSTWLLRIFEEIEKDTDNRKRPLLENVTGQIELPLHIRRIPSSYHLRWAKVLMKEGYDQVRWEEELYLSLSYDPSNFEARLLRLISQLPPFVCCSALPILTLVKSVRRAVVFRLKSIELLRKTKQTLNKCRTLSVTFLKRMRWLPWEFSLRFRGHSTCFEIFTDMTLPEKLLLYRLAHGLRRGSVIVEVGSYLGASSTFMAAAAKERSCVVYCVDTWMNDVMSEGQRDTYAEFLSNTQMYADQIQPLRGEALWIAKKFSEPIDLLFLDGDHSYAGCRSDVDAWLAKLKPSGIVVFHDIGWARGVQRIVQEIVKPIERSPGHAMDNIYWARIDPREGL